MDKLQELTQKLYEEGLAKGKEEGEELLAKAREEAKGIVAAAREEAEGIIEAARKEADAYRVKTESDVKMAASQAVQATRSSIEQLIVAKAVDAPVEKALSDGKFIREIITEVAKHFSASESADLELVLPEKLKGELEGFVNGELEKSVGKGIDASFTNRIQGGFRIGPKGGSYFISLTDESFKELIGNYMRPATRKLLFG